MDIVLITTVIASLFIVIGIAEPIATWMRLPYSAILAIVGILIGAGAIYFLRTDLTDVLNPAALAILNLPIRSNVFLYVFLPTLLFQATLGMNLRRMLDDWVPILVLAVLAVVVATFAVGFALSWTSSLPLVGCLLVGAIVSTTDPSAVVSIFRSIAAPRRLVRIIEGESLLNDAAAIALFGIFMAFVMSGTADPTFDTALQTFPVLVLGGVAVGWFAARLTVWIMAILARWERAQLSVSFALPYLAYIVAEQSIGASGVIAVVAAGMTLNLTGPARLPPNAWRNLREVWDLLAHWAGALIFILAALLIPRLLEAVRLYDFLLIGVVVVAATLARAVVLFGLLPLLTLMRASPVVERPYRTAILWGGLRGAVTLALALAVTENFQVQVEVKRLVGILATGFTLFTLMVQGTTLRWVIASLGLDRLSPIDAALSNQVVAVALQTVREEIARITERNDVTKDIVRSEAKRFADRLDTAVKEAEDSADILERDRITLGLISLAGFERDTIIAKFRDRAISARVFERILVEADRLIEATRIEGRTGYQRAARRSLSYGRSERLALVLHNRLRVSTLLARLSADRFELLLAQRLILRELEGFIDLRMRRIHGRRVGDLLREMLYRRLQAVETALEGLRLQYPGYAEELERRLIRRTALRIEEREYDAMREDGLIGTELHTSLTQDISFRRIDAEQRPKLDLAVQKDELARQFPLFADLDQATLQQLSRALLTRYVTAGERILSRDTDARGVFFLASGAVEIESAGQTVRLGRGEMFGQLAVLMRRPRRTAVRAITPGTLLVLDEAAFMKLLASSPAVRKAVRDSANRGGVPAEQLKLVLGQDD